MNKLQRGMVIDINLDPIKGSETGKIRPCVVVTNNIYNERLNVVQVVPITEWNEKKGKVRTNVVIQPNSINGLMKQSVADCLQTRPVDYTQRLIAFRGQLESDIMEKIEQALKIVFDLP